MDLSSYQKRGLYFEEFEVGQKFTTAGRTVTEADIVAFAGLSGDYNQIHVDAEYSRHTPVGRRVAHGLLGLSIASGLAVQTGILEGTIIAFREINGWRFVKPVFIGDTIHVDLEVLETKNLSRIGAGVVLIGLDVRNQNDETVMKGTWSALIALRSE
ncbi:MAG: MaoC/PaaZ C-terminal domain-containing protein [Anaerolineales bacterium]|jgi:3-hydroxybutyryl-CoA dehydratase